MIKNTYTEENKENLKTDSMKEKESKVTKSTFSNEWQNPSGGTTYYFDLILANGDTGSIGVMDKNSEKVVVGYELNYTMINGKIKAVSMPNNAPTSKPSSGGTTTRPYGKPNHNSFLGYTWGYAKDLIIAGKTMKDVEELNQVARYIYNEIGKMLDEE